CDSYSKLYKLLLTEAGIENMRVTGRADGGNHAWNAVKIDGVWCQIDVTWDDPPTGSMSFVSGKENYDYFGLNDELMSLDHSYTSPVVCDSLANYYYYRTRQHETWMYLVWDEIEDNLASGLTSFDVDTQGIIVTRVVDNGYSYRYDEWTSTVAAALMSLDPWTFQGGDSVYVTFTYNGETNTMHCEVQMADPCADGHDWGDLIIEWASDGSAVTATRVCSRDETHVETAPAAFVLAQAPTADTAGKTLYTAVFESEPCDAQAIVEDIPALSDLDVLYLPDDLTAIEDEAFMNADCEAVIIPDGCVSIGARAFAGCERLIYISIPASVTDMAEDALEDCAIVRVDVIVE
ncbi:MAG: leucine-rich repeat protein, partial [Clostridia bacterium]|nr:leucine-rich repeat protein [Clostridia bacterium]